MTAASSAATEALTVPPAPAWTISSASIACSRARVMVDGRGRDDQGGPSRTACPTLLHWLLLHVQPAWHAWPPATHNIVDAPTSPPTHLQRGEQLLQVGSKGLWWEEGGRGGEGGQAEGEVVGGMQARAAATGRDGGTPRVASTGAVACSVHCEKGPSSHPAHPPTHLQINFFRGGPNGDQRARHGVVVCRPSGQQQRLDGAPRHRAAGRHEAAGGGGGAGGKVSQPVRRCVCRQAGRKAGT